MLATFRQIIRLFCIGMAIGIADLIPGVSGGTFAFAFGIWERILLTISQLLGVGGALVRFHFGIGYRRLREIDWVLVSSVGSGVLCALFLGASFIGTLFDDHQEATRGFFLGIVVGCLPVPFRLVSSWTPRKIGLLIGSLLLIFILSGIPDREVEDPHLAVLFVASIGSICATILPGLSGSFLLLLFGLYDVFIDAVRERNLVIWAVFAAGAWIGMFLFSSGIRWVLNRYYEYVMAVILGLMIGGLRVLWPWIDDTRDLVLPADMNTVGLIPLWGVLGISASFFLVRLLGRRTEPVYEHSR